MLNGYVMFLREALAAFLNGLGCLSSQKAKMQNVIHPCKNLLLNDSNSQSYACRAVTLNALASNI